MIEYVKGKLVEKTPEHVVIETAGGIAYMIHISLATYSAIGTVQELSLLTHYVIKEDAHVLYGFAAEEERSLFKLLITVSGIGVATARLMLSSLSVSEILGAIATDNARTLQTVKGIGNKSAQRIIIELKDKIGKTTSQNLDKIAFSYNNNKAEALSALVSLGFVKTPAEAVLDKIIQQEGIELSVEELIKKALKLL